MLLRSSSTPVLGSLLSKSISDNPTTNYWCCQSEIPNPVPRHPSSSASPSVHHHYNNKLSSKQLSASQNFTDSLSNSSPLSSPSIRPEFPSKLPAGGGFRRAQSEGNLNGLDVVVGGVCDSIDEISLSNNVIPRHRKLTLEAIPSFSLHNSGSQFEDEDTEAEEEDSTLETKFEDLGYNEGCSVSEDVRYINSGYENVEFGEGREEMFLARGLGVCDGSFSFRGGIGGCVGDRDGGEGQDCHGIEGHYQRLLKENPCNSLYLRNYASFLYKKKKNLESAEDYYSRAILEDPKDGEVLSEYAHLVWDLYRDKDRATSYFERAIKASAENSHVHAAFARFLWEAEEDEEDEDEDKDKDNASQNSMSSSTLIREGVAA